MTKEIQHTFPIHHEANPSIYTRGCQGRLQFRGPWKYNLIVRKEYAFTCDACHGKEIASPEETAQWISNIEWQPRLELE